MSFSLSSTGRSVLFAFVAGAAVATACSNDNAEPSKPPPIGGDDASTGSGGKGSGGKGGEPETDSGTGGDTASGGSGGDVVTDGGGGGGAAGGDASPSAGGKPSTGGAGGADAGPACDPTKTGDHPKACFPCTPSTTTQFLNRCTKSDCQPFDNAARLGAANWNDGKLIPLP